MIETLIVIGIVLLAAGCVGFGLYRTFAGNGRCDRCSGCGGESCDAAKKGNAYLSSSRAINHRSGSDEPSVAEAVSAPVKRQDMSGGLDRAGAVHVRQASMTMPTRKDERNG